MKSELINVITNRNEKNYLNYLKQKSLIVLRINSLLPK